MRIRQAQKEKNVDWVIRKQNDNVIVTIPDSVRRMEPWFKFHGMWLEHWGNILSLWFILLGQRVCRNPIYYLRVNTFGEGMYIRKFLSTAAGGVCHDTRLELGKPSKLDFFSCSPSAELLGLIFSNADVEIPGKVLLISENHIPHEEVARCFAKVETCLKSNDRTIPVCDNEYIVFLCYTVDNQVVLPSSVVNMNRVQSSLEEIATRFGLTLRW